MAYRIRDTHASNLEVRFMPLEEVTETFGGEPYSLPLDSEAMVIIDRGNSEVLVIHGNIAMFTANLLEATLDKMDDSDD